MKVLIPSALRSYTESGWAEANGATLAAVLAGRQAMRQDAVLAVREDW